MPAPAVKSRNLEITKTSMFSLRLHNNILPKFCWNTVAIICRSFSKQKILKNDAIPHHEIRLVTNDSNGKSISQIMSKSEALKIGMAKKLDLILVTDAENPPICKLDNYSNLLKSIKDKETEQKKKHKANAMKEISIGATIDTHDLNIKMKKVNEFLDKDYQVRIIVFATKQIMEKKPLAIDETTLKVLDYLERFSTGPVMPSSKSADRVDFILSPKQRLYKDVPSN